MTFNNNHSKRYNKTRKRTSKSSAFLIFIFRLILGGVFCFSGFVKAIDPLGTAYKMEEYFRAFGGVFESSLSQFSLPLSIFLSSIEIFIGLCLLLKLRFKLATTLALLLMLFMTPFTLYVLIENPVTDCGCFGDAIVISNKLSFIKNIVILFLCIALFLLRKKTYPVFTLFIEILLALLVFCLAVGFSVYSLNRLPLFDFRPYKLGVNIEEAMQVPDGYPTDQYDVSFIYEKDGERKEFTLDNYPKNDSTWVFIDQKQTLISKGYQPPIHDFIIEDEDFEDITDLVLGNKGNTYLFVVYNLEKVSTSDWLNAQRLYNKSILSSNTEFYALVAATDEEIDEVRKKTGVTFPFNRLDPIILKTMIRSNPGIILLKNGTIEKKWHHNKFDWEAALKKI